MYRAILVPLDGSQWSEAAIPTAVAIARCTKAPIHLVHVHAPLYTVLPGTIPVIDQHADRALRIRDATYLESLRTRLTTDDVRVCTALLDGSPAETISAYMSAHKIDLAVFTTHGHSGGAHLWFGSVADQLVRALPAPSLILRPDTTRMKRPAPLLPRQILIPLDGSAHAESAIEPALALGGLTEAAYTLLNIVEQSRWYELDYANLDAPQQELLSNTVAAGTSYLELVGGWLRERGYRITTSVQIGKPTEVITAYSQRHGVDLIALATHGRGNFARWYFGSVATGLMRAATVPLLITRPVHPSDSSLVSTEHGSSAAQGFDQPREPVAPSHDVPIEITTNLLHPR